MAPINASSIAPTPSCLTNQREEYEMLMQLVNKRIASGETLLAAVQADPASYDGSGPAPTSIPSSNSSSAS
jgi:hypothetical protein